MSRSIVLDAPGQARLAEGEPPELLPEEALVEVAAAGVCGSDRELYGGTRPPGFATYPVTPGHEWSGTVVAVGPDAPADLVGARVVGEGYRGCQACTACRSGAANLCTTGYDEVGFTRPGAFADHLAVPARLLHVLAPDADLRGAALLEPAAVAAAAVRRLCLLPGESAVVVGAGTLGALALQFLAAGSPGELLAVDPRPDRKAVSLVAGATAFLLPDEAGDRRAFDVVVETAGAPGTAQASLALARRGARVALIGIPGDPADSVSSALLVTGNLQIHTVFGPGSPDWDFAVRAFGSGALRPGTLITHELPLAAYEEAMRLSAAPDAGKVLLRPDLVTEGEETE